MYRQPPTHAATEMTTVNATWNPNSTWMLSASPIPMRCNFSFLT